MSYTFKNITTTKNHNVGEGGWSVVSIRIRRGAAVAPYKYQAVFSLDQ